VHIAVPFPANLADHLACNRHRDINPSPRDTHMHSVSALSFMQSNPAGHQLLAVPTGGGGRGERSSGAGELGERSNPEPTHAYVCVAFGSQGQGEVASPAGTLGTRATTDQLIISPSAARNMHVTRCCSKINSLGQGLDVWRDWICFRKRMMGCVAVRGTVCLPPTVFRPLSSAHCLPPTVFCPLSSAHCLPPTVCCPLASAHGLLPAR
jgi:hypothetical protein